MKKFSKILCAVLVLALLCSSLIFIVGAEENGDAYESVLTTNTGEILAVLKYQADDNLVDYLSLITNHPDGWGAEGARQSEILTDPLTGEQKYRESANGELTATNEYFNLFIKAVNLQYEEGKREYIVADFDYSFEGEADSKLGFQCIPRDPANGGQGYWPNSVPLRNIPSADGQQVHVTYVIDYTANKAYTFVNGMLAVTTNEGAIRESIGDPKGGHTGYMNGDLSFDVRELKFGSNSQMTFTLDNMYVRAFDLPTEEDTLATAIEFGDITEWSENVYDGFVSKVSFADLGVYGNNITGDPAKAVISGVEGNIVTSLSKVNPSDVTKEGQLPNNGAYINTYSATAKGDPYYVFITNQDYYPTQNGYADKNGDGAPDNDNNPFINLSTQATDFSIAAGTNSFYVFDIDIAGHSDFIGEAGIEVEIRNGAGGVGGGFPFGNDFHQFVDYVSPSNEWQHLTVVGDIANNKMHVFVDGEYVGTAGKAYNDTAVTTSDATLCLKGVRLFLATNADIPQIARGESFGFDNVAVRVYADGDESLAAAVASNDLTSWSGYTSGRGGEKLAPIASVNGVEYNNVSGIQKAFSTAGNKKVDVEFLGYIPNVFPIHVKANATINTNGLPIDQLVEFDESCSEPIVNGNYYTVTIPWTENYSSYQMTNFTTLYNAVKYNHPDNKFSRINGNNYNGENQRWSYLVTNTDTGDVFINDKPGPYGTINGASNTYLELKPNANISYVSGKGQVIIYDMDAAILDHEVGGFNFISRYSNGGGAWGNNSPTCEQLFKGRELGEFVHLTLMTFTDSRTGYYFVNNELVLVLENALTEGAAYLQDLRLFGNHTVNFNYDNVCIRVYQDAELEALAAAGDLSAWDKAIYSDDYVLPALPAVATVDGVPYTTLEALNKALAAETEGSKHVEIQHRFDGVVNVVNDAVVETFTSGVQLDWSSESYEFDPGNPDYVSTETGLAYASSRLIHIVDKNTHKFETINSENCWTNATVVTWFNDDTYENFDVVFYAFGDQIAPLYNDDHIDGGVYYYDDWSEYDVNSGENLGSVTEFPVADPSIAEVIYICTPSSYEVDFAAKDILIGAKVNTNIVLTVYVAKSETVTAGQTVVIGGVEYVAFSTEVAPHEAGKVLNFEFEVVDGDGNLYTQVYRASVADYAKEVFEGEYHEYDKKLLYNFLVYANEAHKLFEGENIASVQQLLYDYIEYLDTAELTDKLDTGNLDSVIRSAALKLDSTPSFVFKVARGFKGVITFTYTGYNGEVTVEKAVDATLSEQLVILDGVSAFDSYRDITLSITKDGETEPYATGSYSLATYAQSIEDNAFATALYSYAKYAEFYKSNLVTVSAGKTVDDAVVVGEYFVGSKIEIPFLRDGLVITWLYNDRIWDFETDVIDGNMVLLYTEAIDKTDLAAGTDPVLKTIDASKIKQFDGCKESVTESDQTKYGYYTKEGGTPKYVTTVKDGKSVEALYFSRTVAWDKYGIPTDGNALWAEHRYKLDTTKKLASISFDYLILGTVGAHQAASGESYGEGIFQLKYTALSAAQLGLSEQYKNIEYGNSTFIEDGAWHTYTYEASNPMPTENFLIKLYMFQGEMVITNIVITYAE